MHLLTVAFHAPDAAVVTLWVSVDRRNAAPDLIHVVYYYRKAVTIPFYLTSTVVT